MGCRICTSNFMGWLFFVEDAWQLNWGLHILYCTPVAKFLGLNRVNIVDSGIGLSFRSGPLGHIGWRTNTTTLYPESTISSIRRLRISPQFSPIIIIKLSPLSNVYQLIHTRGLLDNFDFLWRLVFGVRSSVFYGSINPHQNDQGRKGPCFFKGLLL